MASVSVVVPAYNAERTIGRALDSACAQTYRGICEIIVVDDGSTDATAEIVQRDFPGVTLLRQANQGSAVARNRGVAVARGDYIAFLDSDDEWLPEKTEAQMACFTDHEGLVMTLADAISVVRGRQKLEKETGKGPLVEPLNFRDVFPFFRFHQGCSGWVLQRALFERCGGFRTEMRRTQDSELLWRLLIEGYLVARLRRPLYRYYPSDERRSATDLARTILTVHECIAPMVEQYASLAEQEFRLLSPSEARRRVGRFYLAAALPLWRAGERHASAECIDRALACIDHLEPRDRLRCRLAACSPPFLWHVMSALSAWLRR